MKKHYKIYVAIIVGILALTGCSQNSNSISEEMHTIEKDADGEGLATSADKLTDKLEISEEKWEESIITDYGETINISAKVEVPDTNHMCILSMKNRYDTGEKKKGLVEKICGDGKIYAYEDDNLPKVVLQSSIEKLSREIADMLNAKNNNMTISHGLEGSWNDSDESYYEEKLSELTELNQFYQSAPELEEEPGNYEALNYIVQGEDEQIEIHFREKDGEIYSVSWDMQGVHTVKEDFAITDDYSVVIADGFDFGNLCNLSEENAVRLATEYITLLGFTDFEVQSAVSLSWERYQVSLDREVWTDGYCITFVRSIDGVLEDTTGYYIEKYVKVAENEWRGENDYDDSYGEAVTIYINDTGIFHCEIKNPYEIAENISSNTTLLSYEQVKGVVKTLIPLTLNVGNKYNKMELIYYLDRSGETVNVIPAWRLSENTRRESKDFATDYVVINAIDGSAINIAEQSRLEVSEDIDE